jgi:hypothetical protein
MSVLRTDPPPPREPEPHAKVYKLQLLAYRFIKIVFLISYFTSHPYVILRACMRKLYKVESESVCE